jgi:hypothetical protein
METGWRENHSVAESPQTLYQSSGSSQEVAFVKVVAAQFSVRGSFLQHMVADSQDGARHRNDARQTTSTTKGK